MARVFFGEVLACKDVSKVGTAVDALNFSSQSVGVRQTFYCTRDFLVEAWPAAVCFKLVLGTIQFCTAPFADVGSFFPKRIVLACEGHFGAFVNDNLLFFGGELFGAGLFFRSRQ